MVDGQASSGDVVPERLRGGAALRVRALSVVRSTGELRESDDPSTRGLFAFAEYEFEPSGEFRCCTGTVTFNGRWWRHPAVPVVEIEATDDTGNSLDGFVTGAGDRWRLDALFTAMAHRRCVVSVVRDDLGAVLVEEASRPEPADVPTALGPDIEAVLASVDEFLEGLPQQLGISDDAGDRWRAAFPLDVLVPEFDVAITPADGFPSAPTYQGTLLITPAGDGDHFTVTVGCRGPIDVGWLHWSVETAASTAFTADGGLTVVDDRAHLGLGQGSLAWYPGEAMPPLRLSRSRLSLRFDPATPGVSGQVSAVDEDGGHRVARISGTLRGRVTETLRRLVAHTDLTGHWSAVTGPLRELTVPRRDGAPGPARVTPRLPTGPAFVRLAVGPDLAVGLALAGGDSVPIVLRRQESLAALVAEADDRLSLGLLAKDLALAGRHAAAAPLLRRATELTWARAETDPDFTTGDLIGLISLIDHQVVGAFALRDYPALLEHLAQAVRLRHLLAAEPHTLSSFLQISRKQARDLDSTAKFLAELVPMVDEHLSRPAAPTAGLARLRSALADAERTFAGAASLLRTAADSAAGSGMQPSPQARSHLQRTIDGLQRELRRCADAVRENAVRLLEPNEVAFEAAGELVAERRALIESVLLAAGQLSSDRGDGSAPGHPDVPDGRIAQIDAREEVMLGKVASNPHLTPPLRDLFRMEFTAATKLLGEAAVLEDRARDLDRWEIAERVYQDRADTAPAAARLAEHVERWRALLDEDQEKIAAVDDAVSVFAGLVGLLADLGADWDALVASEQGRARAFADRLRARDDPDGSPHSAVVAPRVDRGALERIVREHGQPVVEYFLRDDELVIWFIPAGAGEVSMYRRKVSRDQVVKEVEELRHLLDDTDPYAGSPDTAGGPGVDERLRSLGDLLWSCLPSRALPSDPDDTVYVVPHDVLFRVPFSALRDARGVYLVDRHALVVLPSIAMLPLLRERHERTRARAQDDADARRRVPRCLAMVSPAPMPRPDPVEFPEIREPLGELEMTAECFPGISRLFGAGEIVLCQGAEATWEAFRAHAPDADVLLFATHAHAVTGTGNAGPADPSGPTSSTAVPDHDPFDSFVALTLTSTHDGLLRARDLGANDLALRADLAILSACSTGHGKVTGDGVLGLSRAFLTAGPVALLMTLEETPEEIALEVVYQFLLLWWRSGLSAAAALRKALIDLRQQQQLRYAHPSFWSLFVLFGLDVASDGIDGAILREETA